MENAKAFLEWEAGVEPLTKASEAAVIPFHCTRDFY